MAGVSTGASGDGGRRAVDADVNMVPMIDLLIAVIAFLLMTAVWVRSGTLRGEQPHASTVDTPSTEVPHVVLTIAPDGLRVGDTVVDAVQIPNGPAMHEQLRAQLASRLTGNDREVWIQPDSAVQYDQVVQVMDTVYSALAPRRRAEGPMSALGRVRFL